MHTPDRVIKDRIPAWKRNILHGPEQIISNWQALSTRSLVNSVNFPWHSPGAQGTRDRDQDGFPRTRLRSLS